VPQPTTLSRAPGKQEFYFIFNLLIYLPNQITSFLSRRRMGLHLQVEDVRAFCHNIHFSPVNDKAEIWIETAKVRNKLLSLYSQENICLYSLSPVLLSNAHLATRTIFWLFLSAALAKKDFMRLKST
jgi:hypothetical protein